MKQASNKLKSHLRQHIKRHARSSPCEIVWFPCSTLSAFVALELLEEGVESRVDFCSVTVMVYFTLRPACTVLQNIRVILSKCDITHNENPREAYISYLHVYKYRDRRMTKNNLEKIAVYCVRLVESIRNRVWLT